MKISRSILCVILSLILVTSMMPSYMFLAYAENEPVASEQQDTTKAGQGGQPSGEESVNTGGETQAPLEEKGQEEPAAVSPDGEDVDGNEKGIEESPATSEQEAEKEAADTSSEKQSAGNEAENEDNSQAASGSEEANSEPVEETAEETEEAKEETDEESAAGYASNGGVEGVDVSGPAADDEAKAAEILTEMTSLNEKNAAKKAAKLFGATDENAEAETKEAAQEAEEAGETYPSHGDGSNIDVMTAEWITADTVDNGDKALLYVKSNGSTDQQVRLRINYALSGEHSYNPYDITISFPAKIFKTRDGKPTGEIIIPYPEDPSKKQDFNWKQVGDNIVITNTKRMSAATKGYIEIAFDNLDPALIKDMGVSDDFVATIEVTTFKDNTLSLSTEPLVAQFDTEARLTDVNKRNISVTRVKASQIPENQRVEGEESYIKVDWYVWGATNANTYYTVDQLDYIPQAAPVQKKTVVEDGEVKDPNKQISVTDAQKYKEGAVAGDDVTTMTEADIKGFVLGADSADKTELEKTGAFYGRRDGRGSNYSFSTVYPASQFKKDTNYTFNNTIRYTVTEKDEEVKDNTNPNVQKVDPQLVTSDEASASVTWSFTDPKWVNPGGHYMVHKNGNDNNTSESANTTHKSTYSRSDLHRDDDGWYGIYPSAINDLQKAYEKKGEDGSVRLSYTINTIGYTLPWMYDGGVAEFKEGEIPARIIGNYNRPITMTTTDTGISFGRNGTKLSVGTDYTYEEIEFPGEPYVYKGNPQNINADGTWEALDAGDGTFKYTRDTNKTNWPDIKLQLQIDGVWQDWATVSWKTGNRVITLRSGERILNSGVVKVPEGTQNFRTIVTTRNTAGGEGAKEAIQAGIQYDVRPVINLKSTNALMERFDGMFAQSSTPSMSVYNSTNLLIEREDVSIRDAERVIHSIDRDGYDSIRGYTTDTSVYPYKEATQNLREVDYENRVILIHYKARVEEHSVISDRKTWQEAVNEGNLQSENSCTWYDLLPKGVAPKTSTIKLRKGDNLVSADTYENYQNTGRTLLVVKAKLTPVPETYRSGDMTYYMDVPTISFDATYDFESWKDYGSNIHNVVAFESGNDSLGSIPKYTGEPDDPRSSNNVSTRFACVNEEERRAMTDLNNDNVSGAGAPNTFVYAGVTTKVDLLAAARTSLYKDVEVNNDNIWNEGTYYTPKEEAREATEGGNKRTVFEGGQYTYRLRVMSDPDTISAGMILYDALEDFEAKASDDGGEADNDEIDIDAVKDGAVWKGTLREVDVSQLEELGCAPVVYYSTKVRNYNSAEDEEYALTKGIKDDTPNKTNINLSNTDVWVKASDYTGEKSDITAIAIDCTKTKDGKPFKLNPLESAVVLVRMKAPSGEKARELIAMTGRWGDSAQAYNNAFLYAASFKEDQYTGEVTEDDMDFIRKDYTKVGLKEYSLTVDKAWDDDNNRDGKRPETITFELYANGKPTGNKQTMNVAEGKPAVFEHIPYTDDNGEKIHYSVVEADVEGYTADYSADQQNAQLIHVTNRHEPEKTQLSGEKTWKGDEDYSKERPSSIDVELYGNGRKLKTLTVKVDDEGRWRYDFINLYKYENGKEIVYNVKEVKTPGTGNKADSYVPEYSDENLDIVNTYHPFGELVVSKTVENITEVSKNNEFTFTFAFAKTGEDGAETPVFDEFDYEILDEEGKPVKDESGEPITGKVGTNGTVSIKGGQKIHVFEIPEMLTYKVTEGTEDGFALVEKSGDSGQIDPNKTAEVSFTNRYSASGLLNLEAVKKLKDRKINKNQFLFELYEVTTDEDGNEVEIPKPSATNDASSKVDEEDGRVVSSEAPVTFGGIRYTQNDHGKTFTYRIKEVDRGKAGYTYSEDVFEAKVTVVDNGDGTLKITPVYTDKDGNEVDKPVFTNKYEAKGNTKLQAWKDLPGRDLTDGEFEFELLDEKGNPIVNSKSGGQDSGDDADSGDSDPDEDVDASDDDDEGESGSAVTATNKADGTVTFDPSVVEALNYTQEDIGKTFYYAIREKAGDDDSVQYDTAVYGYEVKIVDNGDGTLYAEQSLATPEFDKDDPTKIVSWTTEDAVLPVFKNKLGPGSLSVQKLVDLPTDGDLSTPFKFKVKLIGEDLPEGETEYTITKATEVKDKENASGADSGNVANYSETPVDTTKAKAAARTSGGVELPETGGETPDTATEPSVKSKSAKSASLKAAANESLIVDSRTGSYWGVGWRITTDGVMIFGNEGTTQYFDNTQYPYTDYNAPWEKYKSRVKTIKFEGNVIGRGSFWMMFSNFRNLESADLTNLDMSAVTNMLGLFGNDSRLKTVDMSSVDATSVSDMQMMFQGCSSLESADISGINTSKVTNMSQMFWYCNKLKQIKLSPNYSFKNGVTLPTPSGSQYTGKWISDNEAFGPYTPNELASNYAAKMAGTWVWEEKDTEYTVKFTADAPVAGSMDTAAFREAATVTLPANKFMKHGAEFDHWVVVEENGAAVEDGKEYADNASIEGGTYSRGDVITLKAVFKPKDLKVNIKDGEFEVELYAGEKATFDGIPAGTAYQVYEETPAGWVLVETVNASGIIEATQDSIASFKNEYAPGSASAQFYGTKTLDSKAAANGAFSFELKDSSGQVIQTKSTSDGGFIQFDPIRYTKAGTYKYTITEVAPSGDTIDYDTHSESVTVKVEPDGDELAASVEYDSDGVRFANTTKPGNLKLTKKTDVSTDANKDDEFTFRIRFNNANGQPIGKDSKIYWFTEPAEATESAKTNNEDSGTPKRSLMSRLSSLFRTGKVTQEAEITQGTNFRKGVSLKAAGGPLRAAGDDISPTNFEYTGKAQAYVVPASGYYKLEAWGAQGGTVNSLIGGRGGYSAGTIYLEEGQVIYVYVGGKGLTTSTPASSTQIVNGGWNGGGRAANMQSGYNSRYYGSGGGATDFRLTNGAWNNFDSLKSRIMVAGGGGGATNNSGSFPGGAGGGVNGVSGTGYSWANMSPGYGATQTAGGYTENLSTHVKEKIGAFGYASNICWASAGGGGGYYGGGSSAHSQSGGGGSGFVSGHAGCNAITEDSVSNKIVHTGSSVHYSGMTFTDTVMRTGNQSVPNVNGGNTTGRTGNGYARITPLQTTITYDPNGGTGQSRTIVYGLGEDITLPHPAALGIDRENYIFVGWALDKNAVVPDYQDGDSADDMGGSNVTLYAVWMSENEYLLHFDGNGGFSDVQYKRAEDTDAEITLPEATRPGYIFTGWTLDKDGGSTIYTDKVVGNQIGAEPGKTVTLYAQWASEDDYVKYQVKHYKQNADKQGYSLFESDFLVSERGKTVSPAEKTYSGYVAKEHADSYEVPSSGSMDPIEYYYDLCTYKVHFDGNGATSGSMDDQTLQGGTQTPLSKNQFKKEGYLFTGWTTEADGSGKYYVDQQKVRDLTKTDSATVTLYAKWLSKDDAELEPTNGEIIVKCKAGETIVIPDLPAGTTYTIEEIGSPDGWTQSGEIEGNDEAIAANATKYATANNAYVAEGEALIRAHKKLEGDVIKPGQFTFELYKDAELTDRVETKTNGTVDNNEQATDGQSGSNPYYQTAEVEFTPIELTQDDIGKTLTYYIRETGKDEAEAEGVTIDETVYKVDISVEDAGSGLLTADVKYTEVGGSAVSGEPIFVNTMQPASLKISKTIVNATDSVADAEFTFTVELTDAEGNALDGVYNVKIGDDESRIRSGGTLKLKGGESAVISGLPHGATYAVTEKERKNWDQTDKSGDTGMLRPGRTAEAEFTNTYVPPANYESEGSAEFKAVKKVEGGALTDNDGFTFELTDQRGNVLQTKGPDKVSSDDETVYSSDITFDAIHYTIDDLPYPTDAVDQYVDNKLKASFEAKDKLYDEAKAIFDANKGNKDKTFTYDDFFSIMHGNKMKSYLDDLTAEAEKKAVREADFIYYVKEVAGDDPDVTYDKQQYYFKVHAVDSGTGVIETTVTKWKPGVKTDPETGEAVIDEKTGEPVVEDKEIKDGDITFTNKKSTQIKVTKRWTDNNNVDGYRPSIEEFSQKIHLMNGETEVTDYTPEIKDDGKDSWTIVYTGLPAYDEDGKKITYTVREDEITNYTARDDKTEAADGETLLNVHAPDTVELRIAKQIDGYYNGGADSNVSVGFNIVAYDKADYETGVKNEIWKTFAALTFKKGEGLSKTIVVSNVPKQAVLEVTEVYAGNYTAKDGKTTLTAQYDETDNIWTVSFDNIHRDTPHIGSGVVNKYESGTFKEQQGLITDGSSDSEKE